MLLLSVSGMKPTTLNLLRKRASPPSPPTPSPRNSPTTPSVAWTRRRRNPRSTLSSRASLPLVVSTLRSLAGLVSQVVLMATFLRARNSRYVPFQSIAASILIDCAVLPQEVEGRQAQVVHPVLSHFNTITHDTRTHLWIAFDLISMHRPSSNVQKSFAPDIFVHESWTKLIR